MDIPNQSATELLTQDSIQDPGGAHGIGFSDAFKTWVKISLLSFGGPAGQIAMMHRILVEEKQWISEDRFLHALNYCMLLPGPEAQQLAIYLGWLLHRTKGGIVAGILFVLPGAAIVLVLSILYAGYQDLSVVEAIFFGIKAAVLAVVVEAVLRIGKKVLKNGFMLAIAGAAFIGIYFFEIPFPLIVFLAGLAGIIGGKLVPDKFEIIKGKKTAGDSTGQALDHALDNAQMDHVVPSMMRALKITGICLLLWFGPRVCENSGCPTVRRTNMAETHLDVVCRTFTWKRISGPVFRRTRKMLSEAPVRRGTLSFSGGKRAP